jgi:ABC-type transport system involved in multi-copper enzyme maturation permease subunit
MPLFHFAQLKIKAFFARGMMLFVLAGIVGIYGTSLLGGIVIGNKEIVIKDLGLKVISFFAVVMSVFMGAGEWSREKQEGTISSLLAKPISRIQVVAGSVAGLFVAVSSVLVIAGLFLWILLLISGGNGGFPFLKILALAMGEILVVCTMVTFFSSFTTRYLSGLFTFSFCVTGLFLDDIYTFGHKLGGVVVKKLTTVLYYLFPDLSCFNLSGRIAYGGAVSWGEVSLTLFYGLCYVIFLLMLTGWLFQKRDL